MKLELKYLAGYLPYKLKIKTERGIETMSTLTENCVNIDYEDIYWFGQKHEPDEFKPLLRPLSDLTKEIEVNGEKFIPMIELAKLALSVKFLIKPIVDSQFLKVTFEGHNEDYSLLINKGLDFCLSNVSLGRQHNVRISNQLQLFQKLYEWHFDIHGLIEKGLAIDMSWERKQE